jgi:hypothetical protein
MARSWFDEYGGSSENPEGTAEVPTPEPPPYVPPDNGGYVPPPDNPNAGAGSPTVPTTAQQGIPDWQAYIRQRQRELPPTSASLQQIVKELRAGGWNVQVPTHAGGTLASDDKISVNGQMFDLITGVDGPSPSWGFADVTNGGGSGGSLSSMAAPPPAFVPYDAPPAFDFHDFTYGEFQAPDPEQVKADPSYQFRLKEGEKALEASASARGTLRTGGTLKDISNYASDYASSEYDKIYGRKFNEFQTGYQNALGAYNANRANQYGNYALNAQTGQWEWQSNNAGSLATWAAQYGMGQDEIQNLLGFSQIGANAAAGTPAPVPGGTGTGSTGLVNTEAGYGIPNLGSGGVGKPTGTLSSFGVPSATVIQPPTYAAPTYATSAKLSDLYKPSRRAYA